MYYLCAIFEKHLMREFSNARYNSLRLSRIGFISCRLNLSLMSNLKRILSCRGLLLSVLIGLASLTEAFAWSSPYSTGASPAGSQDAAVQPSYTPYAPTVTPVGATCAPSIANTTGNSPYSNAPSYAPTLGITNIQREGWDDLEQEAGKEDVNTDKESPIGEAWPLLFLAAGYGLYRRRKKEQRSNYKPL